MSITSLIVNRGQKYLRIPLKKEYGFFPDPFAWELRARTSCSMQQQHYTIHCTTFKIYLLPHTV